MAEETQSKWEGNVTADVESSNPDQIWPFFEEFCNLDKFFPSVETCYRVEGNPGQPGLVRHCAGDHGWANEKLLTIDPTNHCLSYAVTENSVGFNNYVASFKLMPLMEGIDGKSQTGCKINWSFTCDPIQGWKLEDLVSYLDNTLQFMVKKLEDAVKSHV